MGLELHGDNSPLLAPRRLALGRMLVRGGSPADAVAILDVALTRPMGDDMTDAKTRYWLAQALVARPGVSPADRMRAAELARTAVATVRAEGSDDFADEIEAWLATQAPARP